MTFWNFIASGLERKILDHEFLIGEIKALKVKGRKSLKQTW